MASIPIYRVAPLLKSIVKLDSIAQIGQDRVIDLNETSDLGPIRRLIESEEYSLVA